MSLHFDPEFLQHITVPLSAIEAKRPAVHDVKARRLESEAFIAFINENFPVAENVENVEQTIYHAEAKDGYSVPVYHFHKKEAAAQAPAIVHFHGGGYISMSVLSCKTMYTNMVAQSGVQIFAVDYRLAPENKFPIPVEDCYAGLTWVKANVGKFGIDPTRIAIMGESGGGGLAAGVALLARDRHLSPPISKQILIYPMLDDRNNIPDPSLEPFTIWKSADNVTGWTAYIGDAAGKDGVSPYAAPARVESVVGLPPLYMDVGGLDIFCKENIEYAARFVAANITTEFHLYPGLPHGFEGISPKSMATINAYTRRLKAIMAL